MSLRTPPGEAGHKILRLLLANLSPPTSNTRRSKGR
jgi:hypothetical protein